jgi:autotransporter family porin
VSFSTLPPGSVLPSDAQCAAEVTKAAENRPGNTAKNNVNEYTGGYRPGNTLTVLNQYDPSAQARVDGNFTGTTKEILQWAACKWGIDQNIVFAQAQIESNWNQSTLGCSGGTTQSGLNGNACVGILQVKAGNIPPTFAGAWPYAWNSTSWNADFALAVRRACYEGKFTWLGNGYAAGNIWGCVGEWDTGDWLSSGANAYITQVQADYNAKAWLKPGF